MSCPSNFVIDEIIAGARKRDAHIDGCESCQRRLAQFEGIGEAARPKVAALIARAEQKRATARGAAWRWWSLGTAVAAAMAAILVIGRPVENLRLKGGGGSVQMYRMRAGLVTKAQSGETFRAGDALRFVLTTPHPTDFVLVEVEGAGKLTVHQRGHVDAGSTALEGSLVLDQSRETEWFVVLLDAKDVARAIREHDGIWLEIRK